MKTIPEHAGNHVAAGEDSQPRQIIGRFLDGTPSPSNTATSMDTILTESSTPQKTPPPVALFCSEPEESFLGRHVSQVALALGSRGRRVHLFTPTAYSLNNANIRSHAVGASADPGILERVQDFARRAGNAFMTTFPSENVEVIGYEWTSAPVLSLLRGLRNQPSVQSFHSLERQRSDLSSEISRKIVEIEHEAVEHAQVLLLHDPATIEVLKQWKPNCVDRVTQCRQPFPVANFEKELDPGVIKAKYQVGPIDPTLLFIGDLNNRYGPDLILKAMPAILRHHTNARLILVGEGDQLWPLKVYARYLLLEYAVRIVGHLQDEPLQELIQASDMIVVPSRESTPWWPIQAGWAARKPVVASHESARNLTDHEKDSVLVYPSENSLVWGVERVLYDPGLAKSIGEAGRHKLEERFGWNAVAEHLEEVVALTK